MNKTPLQIVHERLSAKFNLPMQYKKGDKRCRYSKEELQIRVGPHIMIVNKILLKHEDGPRPYAISWVGHASFMPVRTRTERADTLERLVLKVLAGGIQYVHKLIEDLRRDADQLEKSLHGASTKATPHPVKWSGLRTKPATEFWLAPHVVYRHQQEARCLRHPK